MELWKGHPFHFKVTRTRATKAGDFFCASVDSTPRITVNHDLNPFLFLITYIHEVAHLRVFFEGNRRADPHGGEWKNCFRMLMQPVLTQGVFPEPLLSVLVEHLKNPKASSFTDVALTRALRNHDHQAYAMITVSELAEGSLFELSGKYFRKGKLKRTRFICQDVKSKRHYLVPAEALVGAAQLSLALSA